MTPACGGTLERRYHLGAFDVVDCARCRLRYRQPFPTPEETRALYDDPAYVHSEYFAGPPDADAAPRPEISIYHEGLDGLEARLGRAPRDASLLDVGAGSGMFLTLAQQRGWRVEGVEMSQEHAARASADLGVPVHCADFEDAELRLAGAPYDAITLWDLLEHVRDPDATLERARHLLAPDGHLLIFTIDAGSLFNALADLGYRLTAGRLARPIELLYDARHNYYFTERTLGALIARGGFRVVERHPHRAHLGRWLVEPAPRWVLAGAELVDLASVPLRRQYRQLVFCQKA